MSKAMKDVTVAVLAVDGFEQSELQQPIEAIRNAGARAVVISATRDSIQGMRHGEKGDLFDVDMTFAEADDTHFDAVVLPGGVVNADEIRMHPKAVAFVQAIAKNENPIAVICHGAWLLISAGLVRHKRITSFPSLRDDLNNAGAKWQNAEVVEDGFLISSRTPDDLPAFNRALLARLSQ